MKINPKNNVYLRSLIEDAVTKKEKSSARPTVTSDSIIISDTARLLKECLSVGEPYASGKVAAIREALRRGDYPVDIARLAESLARTVDNGGGCRK